MKYLVILALVTLFAGCAPSFDQVDKADQYYSDGGK